MATPHHERTSATSAAATACLMLLPAVFALSANPGDTALYATYAERMAGGLLPYKHFSAEYPPLAMLFLFAARLPVAFGASYSISFVLLMAALDWGQKWMLRDAFAARPLAYWLACAVGTLLLLPTYFNHFDIAPTFCCSLALVAWLQRPSEWRGWLWLAMAVGLKVVPLALIPVGIYTCRVRGARWGDVAQGLCVCASLIAIPLLLTSVVAGPRAWGWLLFHRLRGLHVASSYAALLYASHGFVRPFAAASAFGSLQLMAPPAPTLAALSPVCTLALLLAPWWQQLRRPAAPPAATGALRLLCVTTCAWLLGNKAFSPQYLVWLLPGTLALCTSNKEGGNWLDGGLLLWACLCTANLHAWEIPMAAGDTARQLWLGVRLLCLACLYVALLAPRSMRVVSTHSARRALTLQLRPRRVAKRS